MLQKLKKYPQVQSAYCKLLPIILYLRISDKPVQVLHHHHALRRLHSSKEWNLVDLTSSATQNLLQEIFVSYFFLQALSLLVFVQFEP